MEWRVQSNLNTLGITDHTMKIEHLSGGQKRRVAMAKVLAEDFDLLLLDEPTNHLDGEMISWRGRVSAGIPWNGHYGHT